MVKCANQNLRIRKHDKMFDIFFKCLLMFIIRKNNGPGWFTLNSAQGQITGIVCYVKG